MRNDKSMIALLIPLVLVNLFAIYGQYGYIRDHSSFPPLAALGCAAAIESIAIYLAYMAHKSLIALDTSLRLRLGAYTFGILAGWMNLSHYSHGLNITVIGVLMGALSASSPWLWGIYSRRMSRDILADKGLIEPGAVRLGNRWIVHPIWCIPVYRHAVWNGIRNPSDAIEVYGSIVREREAVAEIQRMNDEINDTDDETPEIETPYPAVSNANKSESVRIAFRVLGTETNASTVASWLNERGVNVKADFVRSIRSIDKRKEIESNRTVIHSLPTGEKAANDA